MNLAFRYNLNWLYIFKKSNKMRKEVNFGIKVKHISLLKKSYYKKKFFINLIKRNQKAYKFFIQNQFRHMS